MKFYTQLQGCQIFLGPNIPKRELYTKWPQTVPNGHKLYQLIKKYSKWSQNITTFSVRRPYKIYPNRNFWFENKPSGNPAQLTNCKQIGFVYGTQFHTRVRNWPPRYKTLDSGTDLNCRATLPIWWFEAKFKPTFSHADQGDQMSLWKNSPSDAQPISLWKLIHNLY
jgi:hypothetical protein